MVKLHIKRGDESLFLYETVLTTPIESLLDDIVNIYNERLRIDRVCYEIQDLAKHGITMPPNMQGLTDEQIQELQLVDQWAGTCLPSGGTLPSKDPIGRRVGQAPVEKMAEVLNKTVAEARARISNQQVSSDVCLNMSVTNDTMDILRGAVTIVYPMGLPPHDPVQLEFNSGTDHLEGTQASKDVMTRSEAQLWWAGKQLIPEKKLLQFVGSNEKTKIVAKLTRVSQGPPPREAVFTEEQQRLMMAEAYRRQEELSKLSEVSDDSYLNSQWADTQSLRKNFQGVSNISWRPK